MQTAFPGAGAMGSFFVGRLALAGHVVSLLDIDEAHIASIRNILMRFLPCRMRRTRASPCSGQRHAWIFNSRHIFHNRLRR